MTTVLYADGEQDDSSAIRYLFNGGAVIDARTGVMLMAPTLRLLPAGLYRVCVPQDWPSGKRRQYRPFRPDEPH